MNPNAHRSQRRSIRLRSYDYTQAGAYFITICAHERRCVFGRVLDGAVHVNAYGEMVRDCWLATPEHFPHVVIDEWVVMPNHFHGILMIDARRGLACQAPTMPQFAKPVAGSLGTIMGAFKSAATRHINQYRAERDLPPVKVWQRNYYERIIRDEKELNDTRRYIIENPMNWATDENHP